MAWGRGSCPPPSPAPTPEALSAARRGESGCERGRFWSAGFRLCVQKLRSRVVSDSKSMLL